MEKFVKGDIVVIPFPFSNLQGYKRRPSLVLADWNSDDLVLCQITSQYIKDDFAVPFMPNDIIGGTIEKESNIRPNKLFTTEKSIILYKIGTLKNDKMEIVLEKLSDLFGLK